MPIHAIEPRRLYRQIADQLRALIEAHRDHRVGALHRHRRVVARISRLSVERTTIAILPWLVPLLLALAAITYVPQITLWLPQTMGMLKP